MGRFFKKNSYMLNFFYFNIITYIGDPQTFMNTVPLFTNTFFWIPSYNYKTKKKIYKNYFNLFQFKGLLAILVPLKKYRVPPRGTRTTVWESLTYIISHILSNFLPQCCLWYVWNLLKKKKNILGTLTQKYQLIFTLT